MTDITFQTYLNEILEKELVGTYSDTDDTLDDLIDQSKEVARMLMKYDKFAGNLMLISALWARDRKTLPEEKEDFGSYMLHIISTGGYTER